MSGYNEPFQPLSNPHSLDSPGSSSSKTQINQASNQNTDPDTKPNPRTISYQSEASTSSRQRRPHKNDEDGPKSPLSASRTKDSEGGQSKSVRLHVVPKGAHHKKIERLKFLEKPLKGDHEWLKEGQVATEWANLFYDLVVVAVLTIFSTTHEIHEPQVIPIFLSYFIIIGWVWAAQMRYDIRYQANDAYHRIVKGFQISTFVFIGAASGNWNPQSLWSDDLQTRSDALSSFQTVASSYCASRGLLAFQYFICVLQAIRVKRRVTPLLIPMIALTVSTIMNIIAVAIPRPNESYASAKIGLLYGSLGFEVLMWRFQVVVHRAGHVKSEEIGERYGALTLIILGEGFISVIRALNNVITGLDQDAGTTYEQVVWAIIILYMLWLFLFGRFDRHDEISQTRAVIWEGLHVPLHFCILLLLAGMVNTINDISIYNGIQLAAYQMDQTIGAINNGTELSEADRQSISGYIGRLELLPSYDAEYELLTSIKEDPNAEEDLIILEYQYYSQIVVEAYDSYGIELNPEQSEIYESIYGTNTSSKGSDLQERRNNVTDLLVELSSSTSDTVASGILWLFPSAGMVLTLGAIRSMLWYRYEGWAHYVVHFVQIFAGIGLSLCGLLDIGNLHLDVTGSDTLAGTAPMYQLLGKQAPLIVIASVYWGVYYGTLFILGILHRVRGGVYKEEEEEEEEREEEAEAEHSRSNGEQRDSSKAEEGVAP